MRYQIPIGSSPWGEECVQTIEADYSSRARQECQVFASQLKRHYREKMGQDLPQSVRLKVKGSPHDFTTYYEVYAECSESDEEGMEALFELENNSPEKWDELALAELRVNRLNS
jgi:hypothetical protein